MSGPLWVIAGGGAVMVLFSGPPIHVAVLCIAIAMIAPVRVLAWIRGTR